MAKQKRTKKGYLRKSFTYNNKRYYVYARTSQELTEKEIEKKRQLENGEEKLFNPTLDAYYDHFTSLRRNEIKESTIRAQKSQYKTISVVIMDNGQAFGTLHIKDATRKLVLDAREKLLKEGKTPQNLNICFAHLNHVFSSAVLDETIDKNPCKALPPLKREMPPISENKHRALTEEETRLFFSAAKDSYYYNDFLLMIKTGMRIGEVTALYPTDIDKKNGFIHIRRSIARDETGAYIVGQNTKTKNGKRDIPATDEIFEIIKDQEEMNRMIFGLERNGLLFKSVEGKILREYSINREIKRICKAIDIPQFTCHAFRNTFATRFIEQRPQDYKILSEILGHKDISITLNLYTHVMTEGKVRAMNEIEIKVI